MRRMFQLIQKAVLKYKLHVANGHERAELLRNRFYFLGKNVELYTSLIGNEPY